MAPSQALEPSQRAVTESSLLADHDNNPSAALSALVVLYNDLVRSHATLQFEKEAAERAAERSALENQQLWRSFKDKAATGSPRPAVNRQNSEGTRGGAAGGTVNDTASSPSTSSVGNGRLDLPPFSSDLARAATHDMPNSPSTSHRSKTDTPPPQPSPRTHSRSASPSSLRKASSLDLGRAQKNEPPEPDAAAIAGLPPPTRSMSDPRHRASPRIPTSASMPSMQMNNDGYNEYGQPTFLPSIIPVSPLHVGHGTNFEGQMDSPSTNATGTPVTPETSQLHPHMHNDSRRTRSPSNNSSSSQGSGQGSGSGMDDERRERTASNHPRMSPLEEAPPMVGLYPEEPAPNYSYSQVPPYEDSSAGAPVRPSVDSNRPSKRSERPREPPVGPRPDLVPAFLPYTRVRIASTNFRINEKGKEAISFFVDVNVTIPPESDPDGYGGIASWKVEKLHAEFVTLDSAVRSKASRSEGRALASLPDKSIFKDHAPAKSDQRKSGLEHYLQTLINARLNDRTAVCRFLNSDIVTDCPSPGGNGLMQGWLTKRGRNFGGWQTRFYVLSGDSVCYYDGREGNKLGEIPLQNSQIGRQSRSSEVGDDSYLHAFLIRTTTKGRHDKDEDADHILCAESDDARDAWIAALTTVQNQRAGRANGSIDQGHGRSSPEEMRRHNGRRRSGSVSAIPESHSQTHSRRLPSSDLPPSASLPSSLDQMARGETGKRAAAELGQYGEPQPRGKLQPPTRREPKPSERPSTPDRRPSDSSTPHRIVASQVSGPMNATPLPSGTEFKKAERQKKTKSSFWNFSSRNTADKGPSVVITPHAPARPVFGVPLKEAVAVSRIRPGLELPAVVYRCVEYLEAKNAESEEGIFRLSGSANVIRLLKDRFNAEGDVPLLQSAEYYDPHAIAGLLKTFLRELPVHILTRELHPEFIAVIDLKERKDRVNALGKLVARLPIEEYTLFRFFFAHLCVIAQNAEVSKMNLRNLGIVFSPTLAIPAPLFSLLLSEFDLVFAVEPTTGASQPIMVDDEPQAEARPGGTSERRARPNSELYVASGADNLMEKDGRATKLEEQPEEESELDLDVYDDRGSPLPSPTREMSTPEGAFLDLPRTPQPPHPNSPLSSPRTPTFPRQGLPASPRPGQTFPPHVLGEP
ncbi:RalA-binding protein 1 [Pseudohyphozyma bogoriensis]|nr:RalA-binding protein 1 [Pseudohyphozyma bogoriensis]